MSGKWTATAAPCAECKASMSATEKHKTDVVAPCTRRNQSYVISETVFIPDDMFSATAGLHVSLWFQEFRNVMLCCNLRHRTRPFVRVEKMYKAEVGRWVLFLINACQCDHVSGVLYRPRCVIMCLHGRADGREAGGRWTGASACTATLVASWKSALDGERRKGSWVTSRSIWWRGYLDDARRLIDKDSSDAARPTLLSLSLSLTSDP